MVTHTDLLSEDHFLLVGPQFVLIEVLPQDADLPLLLALANQFAVRVAIGVVVLELLLVAAVVLDARLIFVGFTLIFIYFLDGGGLREDTGLPWNFLIHKRCWQLELILLHLCLGSGRSWVETNMLNLLSNILLSVLLPLLIAILVCLVVVANAELRN